MTKEEAAQTLDEIYDYFQTCAGNAAAGSKAAQTFLRYMGVIDPIRKALSGPAPIDYEKWYKSITGQYAWMR